MRRVRERGLFLTKRDSELIVLSACVVHVCGSVYNLYRGHLATGLPQRKLRKPNLGFGSNPKRAAILKLNLRTPVVSGTKLRALGYRQIRNRPLVSRAAVNLQSAFDVAEANDANLRVRECGNRSKAEKQGCGRRSQEMDTNAVHGDPPDT